MNRSDLLALLPVIVAAATAVAVLVAICIRRSHLACLLLTVIGLSASLASLAVPARLGTREVRCTAGGAVKAPAASTDGTAKAPPAGGAATAPVTMGAPTAPLADDALPPALLVVDSYGLFYMGLMLVACLAVAMLSHGYLARREGKVEEYYVLLVLATLGAMVLVISSHFVTFFLGLEILSVSLYALVAYQRSLAAGIEAGVKYLVLAGVSSAFLLLGMALVYADLGTMEFMQMAARAAAPPHPLPLLSGVLLPAGLALIVVAVGFKLALVPFHLWTPDVYQGAPAPVTAFVATVSKGAVFALVLRYFAQVQVHTRPTLLSAFAILAIASMFAGNLLALRQNNVKRLLAYSSIAHMGYLLVAFIAGGRLAATAVTYYLVAYIVTSLAAFGVVTVLSPAHRDAEELDDYRGLAWRRPGLAAVFTAALLSLAGIPITAGFVGKFYVLAAGVRSSLWVLVVLLAVNSAIGLYYYLRLLVALYRQPAEAARAAGPVRPRPLPLLGGGVLAVLVLLLIYLGVYPAPMLRLIEAMVTRLF